MTKKPSERNKTWEKERRDRLNKSFDNLAKLLPNYDPSIVWTKIEIIQKSILYIETLQQRNERYLATKNPEEFQQYNELIEALKCFQNRNGQLSEILKNAKVPVPPFNLPKYLNKNYELIVNNQNDKTLPHDFKKSLKDCDVKEILNSKVDKIDRNKREIDKSKENNKKSSKSKNAEILIKKALKSVVVTSTVIPDIHKPEDQKNGVLLPITVVPAIPTSQLLSSSKLLETNTNHIPSPTINSSPILPSLIKIENLPPPNKKFKKQNQFPKKLAKDKNGKVKILPQPNLKLYYQRSDGKMPIPAIQKNLVTHKKKRQPRKRKIIEKNEDQPKKIKKTDETIDSLTLQKNDEQLSVGSKIEENIVDKLNKEKIDENIDEDLNDEQQSCRTVSPTAAFLQSFPVVALSSNAGKNTEIVQNIEENEALVLNKTFPKTSVNLENLNNFFAINEYSNYCAKKLDEISADQFKDKSENESAKKDQSVENKCSENDIKSKEFDVKISQANENLASKKTVETLNNDDEEVKITQKSKPIFDETNVKNKNNFPEPPVLVTAQNSLEALNTVSYSTSFNSTFINFTSISAVTLSSYLRNFPEFSNTIVRKPISKPNLSTFNLSTQGPICTPLPLDTNNYSVSKGPSNSSIISNIAIILPQHSTLNLKVSQKDSENVNSTVSSCAISHTTKEIQNSIHKAQVKLKTPNKSFNKFKIPNIKSYCNKSNTVQATTVSSPSISKNTTSASKFQACFENFNMKTYPIISDSLSIAVTPNTVLNSEFSKDIQSKSDLKSSTSVSKTTSSAFSIQNDFPTNIKFNLHTSKFSNKSNAAIFNPYSTNISSSISEDILFNKATEKNSISFLSNGKLSCHATLAPTDFANLNTTDTDSFEKISLSYSLPLSTSTVNSSTDSGTSISKSVSFMKNSSSIPTYSHTISTSTIGNTSSTSFISDSAAFNSTKLIESTTTSIENTNSGVSTFYSSPLNTENDSNFISNAAPLNSALVNSSSYVVNTALPASISYTATFNTVNNCSSELLSSAPVNLDSAKKKSSSAASITYAALLSSSSAVSIHNNAASNSKPPNSSSATNAVAVCSSSNLKNLNKKSLSSKKDNYSKKKTELKQISLIDTFTFDPNSANSVSNSNPVSISRHQTPLQAVPICSTQSNKLDKIEQDFIPHSVTRAASLPTSTTNFNPYLATFGHPAISNNKNSFNVSTNIFPQFSNINLRTSSNAVVTTSQTLNISKTFSSMITTYTCTDSITSLGSKSIHADKQPNVNLSYSHSKLNEYNKNYQPTAPSILDDILSVTASSQLLLRPYDLPSCTIKPSASNFLPPPIPPTITKPSSSKETYLPSSFSSCPSNNYSQMTYTTSLNHCHNYSTTNQVAYFGNSSSKNNSYYYPTSHTQASSTTFSFSLTNSQPSFLVTSQTQVYPTRLKSEIPWIPPSTEPPPPKTSVSITKATTDYKSSFTFSLTPTTNTQTSTDKSSMSSCLWSTTPSNNPLNSFDSTTNFTFSLTTPKNTLSEISSVNNGKSTTSISKYYQNQISKSNYQPAANCFDTQINLNQKNTTNFTFALTKTTNSSLTNTTVVPAVINSNQNKSEHLFSIDNGNLADDLKSSIQLQQRDQFPISVNNNNKINLVHNKSDEISPSQAYYDCEQENKLCSKVGGQQQKTHVNWMTSSDSISTHMTTPAKSAAVAAQYFPSQNSGENIFSWSPNKIYEQVTSSSKPITGFYAGDTTGHYSDYSNIPSNNYHPINSNLKYYNDSLVIGENFKSDSSLLLSIGTNSSINNSFLSVSQLVDQSSTFSKNCSNNSNQNYQQYHCDNKKSSPLKNGKVTGIDTNFTTGISVNSAPVTSLDCQQQQQKPTETNSNNYSAEALISKKEKHRIFNPCSNTTLNGSTVGYNSVAQVESITSSGSVIAATSAVAIAPAIDDYHANNYFYNYHSHNQFNKHYGMSQRTDTSDYLGDYLSGNENYGKLNTIEKKMLPPNPPPTFPSILSPAGTTGSSNLLQYDSNYGPMQYYHGGSSSGNFYQTNNWTKGSQYTNTSGSIPSPPTPQPQQYHHHHHSQQTLANNNNNEHHHRHQGQSAINSQSISGNLTNFNLSSICPEINDKVNNSGGAGGDW